MVDGSGLIVACCCSHGRLVEQVMESEPCASAAWVFWVVDNGSSHRGQASIDRLEGDRPTLRLHLPVHTSWLNQVEISLERLLGRPTGDERLLAVA